MKIRKEATLVGSARSKASFKELYSLLSWTQSGYYLVTAGWALVSIRTFMRVTGPKTGVWLVKTASALISAIGVVLAYAAKRRDFAPEVPLLAISSAIGLAAVDIVYVAKRRISPVYLLDAIGEAGLVGLWVALLNYKRAQEK